MAKLPTPPEPAWETGSRIATLKHPSRVQAIAWRDDVRVLTVCADFILREWDARDGTLLRETKAADLPAAKLAGITLSPDARWLGSHFNDGAALLHDTMTGELRLTLARHRAQFFSWSPCGRFIALQHPAAHASEIILYDAATARPAGAPVALPDGCTAFALSHGATHLAYATEDNKAWVLDLATRRRTGPFAHDSTVRALTFAAGATILASGAQDGTLHLWDTATTEPLAPPLRHPSWIVSITATPDHRTFIVSENSGHASVWTIPALALSPLEMQKIAGDSVPK